MESSARDSHYKSQLMHFQTVSAASTTSTVKDPLAIQMNLKDVKIRPSSSTLKAAGDEEIYAVSPRAPLLTTDLQNNAYVVGEARFGQLGSGVRPPSHHKLVPSPQPTSVAGDNSWAVISLGTYHAAAITSQGRLFCWGLNSKGQCGIAEPDPADKGRITYYPGPARVKSSTTGSTFKAVACGEEHTVALGSRGLCAWGNNSRGQLGLGPGSPSVVWRPMLVSSLGRTSITQLVCGGQFTLALTAQSQVLAWGANDCGQLGQGDVLDRHTPTQVDGLWGLPITRLAVGDAHALALTTTGQLYSWGKNAHGQCGVVVEAEDSTAFASAAPATPTALQPTPAPAAAPALLFGQDYRNGPVQLPAALRPQGGPAVLEQWRLPMLTMGIEAEQADMSLHVTGWRGIEIALEWLFSQNEHEVRRQVDRWRALLKHHVAAEAAAAQQQASPAQGSPQQQQSQQQAGRTSGSNIPNQDRSSSRSPSGSNQRIIEGSLPPHGATSHQKSRFSRVKQEDEALAAGNALANGPSSNSHLTDEPAVLVPTQVALQGVRHVAAGTAFSVAVLEQGDVYSWGQGKWGALGHGDDSDRPLPTWIEALEHVVAERVSCGQYHTCIITREGVVYGCGRCEAGQLGHLPAPRDDTVTVDNVSVKCTPVALQLTQELIEQLSASQSSPFHQGSPNGAASAYSDGMSDSDGPNSRDMTGTPMSVDRQPTSPTSTINYPALTRSPNTPAVVVHEVVAGGCNTAILLRKQQEAPSPWQVTLLAKLQANVARALLLQNNGQGPTPQLAAALRNVAKGAQLVLSSPAALCAALAVRPKTSNLARTISSHDSHIHSMASSRRARGRDGLQSHKSHGLASKISYTTTSTNMVPAPLALPLDIPLYDQLYCSLLELSGINKDPATSGSLSANFDDQGPAMCELQRYALQQTLMRCGLTLCEDLMGHSAMLKTPERAQVLLAAMHCPLLSDANNAKQLLPKLCHAVMAAPAAARRLLVRWWASYPAELMQERLVQPMQAYITKELAAMKKLTSSIMAVIKVLARVEAASQLAGGLLPPEAFYNTLISEKMDVQDHYSAWRTTQDLGGGLPGARPVTNTSGIQLYANEPDSDPESPRRLRRLRHAAASKAQAAAAAAAQQMAASRSQQDSGAAAHARSSSPRPGSSYSDGAAGGSAGSHANMHPALAEVVHGHSHEDSRSETPERPGRSSDQGSGGELADHDVGDMPSGMRMSDPGRRTQGGGSGLPPLLMPGSSGSGTTHPQRRSTLTGSTSELVSRRSTQPPPDLRMDPESLNTALYGQQQRTSTSSAARGVDDHALPSPTSAWGSGQQSTQVMQLTLPPLPSPPGMHSAVPSPSGGSARTSRSGLPPRSVTPPPTGSVEASGRRSLTGSGSRNPYTDMDEAMPPHPGLARVHRMSESGAAGPLAGSPSAMPGTPTAEGSSSRRASASGAASSSQPQHHSTPLPQPLQYDPAVNSNPSGSSGAAERAASTPAAAGASSSSSAAGGANPAAPAAAPARSTEPGPFSFCTYPFLLDARAKSNLLHIEARFQMEQTVAHARMEQQLYGQHSRFGRSENGAAGSGRQRHSENGSVHGRTSPSQDEDLMIHVLEKVHAAEDCDDEWAVGNAGGSANRSSSTPGHVGDAKHGHVGDARHGQRRAKGFRGLLAALLRPTGRSSPGFEEDTAPAVDRAESFRLPRPRDCTMPATHSDMCMVRVRRTHLVEDALDEITRQARRDLYKPLRVHFIGEDGIDAGGVKKEFFALLLAELLKPEFGLMEIQPESNTYWLPRNTTCAPYQYQLLGLVLGLAVYNRVLLDFPLPLAAYKKMLGLPVTLRDLEEMIPSVGKGLKALLEYEGPPGTIEDELCLTWVVEEEVWGQRREVELVPGGSNLPVTEDNREAYVEARLDYYLNKSVRWQFESFARGFGVLINGPALRLFNAQELERLVCGNPTLDWAALQRNAKYEGGYNANSPVVTWLWDIVRNELPLDEKKRFLKFFTGSDRAPIGGLGTLRCIIQRAGPDSDRLPTSHTCFNTLLLPEYLQRSKLARLLRTAINNAEGFGME